MKIRVVSPLVNKDFEAMTLKQLSAVARPDTELSVVSIDRGPVSIESSYDAALAQPAALERIVEAERDGMDAVVCNCMCDVGVDAGRELVSIPVLGPAETSMHVAAMLGPRFSVIDILESTIPDVERRAAQSGVAGQLASVRAVNIPVLELDPPVKLLNALLEQALKAVREDGAHLILFGCTGMAGLANALQGRLRKEGIDGVPVVDPAALTLKIAEALVEARLSHSKRTYPRPPQKEIVGYPRLA